MSNFAPPSSPQPRREVAVPNALLGSPLRDLVLFVSLLFLSSTSSWAAESRPTLSFDQATYEFREDAGTVFPRVRLSNCAARKPIGAVQLRVVATNLDATEGEDFFAFAKGTIGTVEATSNSSVTRVFRTLEVPIQIVHDELEESTESLELQLVTDGVATLDCGNGKMPVVLGDPVRVTILDVPFDQSTVSFSRTEAFVTEGDGKDQRTARFEVVRLSGSDPISALCQTTRAGTASEHEDFEPTAVVLGWGEDDASTQVCDVSIVSDDTSERTETVQLVLEPLEGHVTVSEGKAIIHIADDDSPGRVQFTATHFEVKEGQASAAITLARKGGTEGDATVTVSVQSQGAKRKKDYVLTDNEVTWPDGEAGTRTLEILIVDDLKPEPEETLVLSLDSSNPQSLGDLRNAVLTISDNDS